MQLIAYKYLQQDTTPRLTPWMVDILASSGLFNAEFNDGSVMDLGAALDLYNTDTMSGYDWGDFTGDMKRVFSKPLKYLPQIVLLASGVALATGASGGILGSLNSAIGNAVEAVGGAVDKLGIEKLIATKEWKAINRIARIALQAGGILPTEENIAAYAQRMVGETVTDWSQNGVPDDVLAYEQAYYSQPVEPAWKKWIVPVAIAAGGLAIGLVMS